MEPSEMTPEQLEREINAILCVMQEILFGFTEMPSDELADRIDARYEALMAARGAISVSSGSAEQPAT